jgi:signal transduction histidine kinase
MELMRSFNDASARLQESHDRLQRRVSELTRELEEKNRELARRNRLALIGEMAACVAHEIRNPLGGIQMWASLLEEELPKGETRATLGKMMKGIRGLDALVEDMLAFARDMTLEARPTVLRDVLGEAASAAEHVLAESGVALRMDVAPAHRVQADGPMLARVFLNLIVNAAQAMRDGGTITVEAGAAGGRVTVTVRDSGPGIPEDALARLFTPFFTNRSRGTGLGLAIAHRITEAHGGSIHAANHPAGGAVFTVILPAAE